MLAALNADLDREYQMIICYLYHLYSAAGQDSAASRETLRARIATETSHADQLARLITALGGVPAVQHPQAAPWHDGADLLGCELALERQMIAAYEERCHQAADDPALHAVLRDILAAERAHVAEIEAALAARESRAALPPLDPPPLTAVA
jgi:bacterioferritin (cytochrome b1)